MQPAFDRTEEDLGNVVALEHVNVTIPDQIKATEFYVTGLGLTRDPYMMTGTNNMWVNVGRSQFHLPTRAPQVVRGCVGIVLPDREALLGRLRGVAGALAETRFAFRETEDYVEATSPWGNRIRCHAPSAERFGPITLGMPYVELAVPPGVAEGIVRFYRQILGARAVLEDGAARIEVGMRQHLLYRETDAPLAPYDGHHLQVYVADFSGPHRRLLERGLVTEESDQHQYRFVDLVDPDSGRKLFALEHEVRSMRHPLYARPLVNRNPSQTNTRYAPGRDAAHWSMPHPDW
jgi:catechol 2,3-dioxygenase-like lactoylglutathione lyase family enzyme